MPDRLEISPSNATTTEMPDLPIDPQLHRAYDQSTHLKFFHSGCCIPTMQAFWMLLFMIMVAILMICSFCCLAFVAKGIYKKRRNRKIEEYEAKYRDEEANKKEREMRLQQLKTKQNTNAVVNGNGNVVNILENDVKLARMSNSMISRELMQQSFVQLGASRENQTPLKSMMTKSNSIPPLPLIVHKPATNVTPAVVYSTSATTNGGTTGITSTTSGVSTGTTEDTTGWTEAYSRMTVDTVGEKDSRFHMKHETLAATVGLMATHCGNEKLDKKELRNRPPILYSKNPRTATSAETTGTTGTDSRLTVTTAGEKDRRFDMQHETLAAAVGLMASHCGNEKLDKKELRNKPPILYSKNPRRMDASLDKTGLSSTIIDMDSAPSTPKKSMEDVNKNVPSPSEISVSIPTVSVDDEEGDKKQRKPKKTTKKSMKKKWNVVKPTAAVPPKRASLTTIEEDEDYKPEYSARANWKTGSTFPYYKDSPVKKKKSLAKDSNVSPSVVKADRCLSTSATTRLTEDQSQSSSPMSDVVSRAPNVYQLRQDADRKRRQVGHPAPDYQMVEEKQKQMKNRMISSNGGFGQSTRIEEPMDNGRNTYETQKSPYDIGYFMDGSNSNSDRR